MPIIQMSRLITFLMLMLAAITANAQATMTPEAAQVQLKEQLKVLKDQMRVTRDKMREETRQLNKINREIERARAQQVKDKLGAKRAKQTGKTYVAKPFTSTLLTTAQPPVAVEQSAPVATKPQKPADSQKPAAQKTKDEKPKVEKPKVEKPKEEKPLKEKEIKVKGPKVKEEKLKEEKVKEEKPKVAKEEKTKEPKPAKEVKTSVRRKRELKSDPDEEFLKAQKAAEEADKAAEKAERKAEKNKK